MTITVSEEVRDALESKRPVVALESTIVAHGFPRPDNLQLGRDLEDAVRGAGAVPATIAIIAGEVRIGLTPDGMERIANGVDVEKCSLRDLAAVSAGGGDGATTVASTMRLAAQAGIRVFATGGIGGVHPGAGDSFDVSADLPELGRSAVAVVCAGAKSILDLPATLEVLETQGVPVIGMNCDEFPAFHARSSGLPLRHRCDDEAELAALLRQHWDLGLTSGVLVCNPPPAEMALTNAELRGLLEQAEREATAAGVHGAGLTPFLLAALNRLSNGRTQRVNRTLAIANAELGGRIAQALADLA